MRAVGRRLRAGAALILGLGSLAAATLGGGCAASLPDAAESAAEARPPAGGWLRDEQGREYAVERIPKTQARRLGPGDVRTSWGMRLDVVGEDEGSFSYRLYRTDAVAAPLIPEEPRPDPAETKRVAAAYRVATRATRRLGLEPFDRGLPRAGQWRQGFSIADMDGDGRPDIVHGPPRKAPGPPSVFLGDGAGGWRRWQAASWPQLPFDYGDAAAGDLNGDGRPDLVLGVHLRGLIALLGDGAGGFAEAGHGLDFDGAGGAPGFSSRAVRIADVDGDGRPDIVALAEGPRPGARGGAARQGIAVYINGGGAWRLRHEGLRPRGLFGTSLAIRDFDGDGRLDVATASGELGRRDLLLRGLPGGGWEAVELTALRPAALAVSVAAADFDGDGRTDLAVAYRSFEGRLWHSGIDVLLGAPGAPLSRRVPLLAREGIAGPTAIGAGDVDGDGRTDLAALTAEGELLLFPGDGRGGFTRDAAGRPPFGPSCAGAHLEAADLDGDGRAEIVGSFGEEETRDPVAEAAGLAQPARCPSGGGLAAWKVVPRR